MRLICTAAGVACSVPPIDGNAGRYMSMANGPTAVMRPSTMASWWGEECEEFKEFRSSRSRQKSHTKAQRREVKKVKGLP
jgi:hypothetical protein